MDALEQLGLGLGGLPLPSQARTRSISPENPTGEKGRGGMAVPDHQKLPFSHAASDLGQGWKVSPFYKVKPGETLTLMDVEGPGLIQHIWLVADPARGRSHVLRFYWDGEETPLHRDSRLRLLRRGPQPVRPGQLPGRDRQPQVGLQLLLAHALPPPGQDQLHQRRPGRVGPSHLPDHLCRDRCPRRGRLSARPVAAGRHRPRPSRVRDRGRHPRAGQVRRDLPGMDAIVGRLVRGRGDQVLHRRGQGVPHHLRQPEPKTTFAAASGSPKPTARPTPATCSSIRGKTAPPSGASTAGTSGIPSASSRTCASPSRPWDGGRTGSTSRWPMTSPRWPTGTSPNRTRPFRSCPGRRSAGRADRRPGRQPTETPRGPGPPRENDMAQLTLATCQFEIRTQVAENLAVHHPDR